MVLYEMGFGRYSRNLVLLLVSSGLAQPQFINVDEGLQSFVTRPDLRPPRFHVQVHNASLLSPGYWFLSPIEYDRAPQPGDGHIGPCIYDESGELVWSGASLFNHWNALDFKLSEISGEMKMTLLIQQHGNGYVVNDDFEIESVVDIGELGVDFNMHEFLLVENGAHAIVVKDGVSSGIDELDKTRLQDSDVSCRYFYNGFNEIDMENGNSVFAWNSLDHVSPDESTYRASGGSPQSCTDSGGWDYFHLNSVDKDSNGDYLLSARHTDTIYKVSGTDGSILWRLGGQSSDFEMDGFTFSRQHDARFRGQNGTHTFISLLDNAAGQDDQTETAMSSRALQLALRTDVIPMTAVPILSIPHPNGRGSFASRRGNYQTLQNGNSFIGWSELAMHSEHSPDGSLIMTAMLAHRTLGSYRSYKFPFVGRPKGTPDVYSAAYVRRSVSEIITLVYVSWNGATEVDSWRVFKTTPKGEHIEMIGSKKKTGFETAVGCDGYAAYVIVAAVGKDGKTIQVSNVIKTIPPPRRGSLTVAMAEEMLWLQRMTPTMSDVFGLSARPLSENALWTYGTGCICGWLGFWIWQRCKSLL